VLEVLLVTSTPSVIIQAHAVTFLILCFRKFCSHFTAKRMLADLRYLPVALMLRV